MAVEGTDVSSMGLGAGVVNPHGQSPDMLILSRRVKILEDRVKTQDMAIRELTAGANLISPEKLIDEILHRVENNFCDVDYVQSAHYFPLENNTLQIIIIHNLKDRVGALESVCKIFSNIEDEFSDVDFRPVLLHSSEVQPDRLMGTSPIFER